MCNVDLLLGGNSGAMKPTPPGAVEVTRDGDRVLLRTGPEPPLASISVLGFADFVGAVNDGEFDATLIQGDVFRTSEVTPGAADVVEVTRADGGVLLRAAPGAPACFISLQAWAGLLSGISDGVFNHALPSSEDAFTPWGAPEPGEDPGPQAADTEGAPAMSPTATRARGDTDV